MRRSLVVGNWKMNGSEAFVEKLLADLIGGLSEQQAEIAVCPGYVHIAQATSLCAGTPVVVGGQDCSHVQSGAYTGEVAAAMLCDLGCQWVILGHSERRQYHGELSALIGAKLAAAVEAGLRPILCVGETREQRENGDAETIVASQLRGALLEQANLSGLVVAYEPVWAIGTGLTASPEQAQEMHAFIRSCLEEIPGVDAGATRLLYGGSVKGANAAELFFQPDIDGALVGGAALDATEFLAIINAA
ncbi:MAG: triose-phosphate isomerase [Proteobacteria bacterium]|nr:triose-phosphate isomerase [Pseudomonadota bacterium]